MSHKGSNNSDRMRDLMTWDVPSDKRPDDKQHHEKPKPERRHSRDEESQRKSVEDPGCSRINSVTGDVPVDNTLVTIDDFSNGSVAVDRSVYTSDDSSVSGDVAWDTSPLVATDTRPVAVGGEPSRMQRDGERDRETERERGRETQREREREGERNRDRERDRETERQRETQREREREGETQRERERHTDTQRERDGERETRRERDGERETQGSSCVSLIEMKRIQNCDNKLGKLSYSRTHTVLVDVDMFHGGAVVAQDGRDVWQSNFVKMPCSPASVFIKKGFTKSKTVPRWSVISEQLTDLAKKKTATVDDVKEAIFKYNPKYKGQWSFDALDSFVKSVPRSDNYFTELFPKIAALALMLPEQLKKALPLLTRGHPASITLSQTQISCLVANAFFCTFPHRNTTDSRAEYHNYPSINFTSLFGNWSGRKKEKLRAIMHYFKVVTDEKSNLNGLVTFERRCRRDTDVSKWRGCDNKMPKLHVTSHGTIETEGTGMLQVDFACSYIGGGVLSSGLVQEEILFLINPELIVSRLFTEKLADNECLVITGSQQFSDYSGFGDSFEWTGPHEDRMERDSWSRLKRQILAIDALHFKHSPDQYKMTSVTRELNKAYCGFKAHSHSEPDIATGKWGCGAFNGDPQLKAVIQLMAAARAKRGLAFFTFEDQNLEKTLEQTHHLLDTEGTTVGKLFGMLEDFCSQFKSSSSHLDLFEFLRKNIGRSKSHL